MQKEKTKRFLAGALLALMEQKPYEKISISEICASAFLSRASFYKYFSSKDELLRYQFKTLLSADYTKTNAKGCLSRLTAALSALQGYTQVISEQRLIEKLLPELVELLYPDRTADRGIYHACYTYLSRQAAVKSAYGLSSELVESQLREAESREPDVKYVPQPKLSPNIVKLSDIMLKLLEAGSSLSELSVKELTAAAGVNRSSFYRCFSDTQDMFFRCIRWFILEDIASRYSEEIAPERYEKYRTLLKNAWVELGIERFAQLYTSILNELTRLSDEAGLSPEHLRNICFAAKRTATLYSFL